MKTNESFFQVDDLGKPITAQIVEAIEKLAAGASMQELKLKLHALNGGVDNALEIATAAHSAQNVDLAIDVFGGNGPAATIVCAAGKPGSRIASMGTTFILNAVGAYEFDTKASDLEKEDKVVYQTLSALTGRRKYILDAIIKGGPIDVRTAKKCGIIDSVSRFRSKYKLPKPKKDANATKTQTSGSDSVNEPIAVSASDSTPASADAPKRRGRRKSTDA